MKPKGFTLIELLVVVAIIGILATVVLASLGSARDKAKEAKLLAITRSIEKGLELYHLDNNTYPYLLDARGSYDSSLWTYGHNDRWLTLSNTLDGYVNFDPLDVITEEGSGEPYLYYHSVDDDYYGLAVVFPGGHSSADSDGGYYSGWYEIGPAVSYCMDKYTGIDSEWSWHGSTTICAGGN